MSVARSHALLWKWSLRAVTALGLFLLASPPARAQAPGDSIPAGPDWLLLPSRPCITDAVTLYIRGYEATPCDSFLAAFRSGAREVTVRTQVRTDRQCFAAPFIFYSVPIPFGTLPAGPQGISIRHRFLLLGADGSLDSTEQVTKVEFQVSDNCPDPLPPIPAEELPFVDRATTSPSPACPDRPTYMMLLGHFNDGCGELVSASFDNGQANLVLAPYPAALRPCPAVLRPWSSTLPMGFFQPGFHHVSVDLTVRGSNGIWPPIPDKLYDGFLDFTVLANCDSLSKPLPYVDFIRIGPAFPDSGPICPTRPIRVAVGGTFPTPCYVLRGVQLIDMSMSPIPSPPIVRLIVDDRSCVLQLCPPVETPWDTTVTIPSLPTGEYNLRVQLAQVSCTDSVPPGNLAQTIVPFRVVPADVCSLAVARCLEGAWEREGPQNSCDAILSPTSHQPAQLTFQVVSGVPLSGLQGVMRFRELGLQIAAIEAIGPAQGMHVSWTRTPDYGARFVMFAEHGAPIPATAPSPVPVLRVSVEPAPIRIAWPDPPVFHLAAEELLGSDVNGQGVPDCSALYGRPPGPPPTATICIERACDFNADGVADVRDLVRMVHCVNHEGPCPPDAGTRFDCNGDSLFGLLDVLCCAAHVLHGPDCPDCPIDTIRVEPTVRASFGDPVRTARGVDVPLRLEGKDRLGAARLLFRFPGGRFDFAGASLTNGSGEWLELHEGQAGQASVGLIATGLVVALPPYDQPSALDMVLHLDLKPGSEAGGEVAVEGGEFSGRDGVMLRVDLGASPRALGATASLSIPSIRPNPSAGTFRISVTLNGPARLDVTVHDLAGRRVASLFHGDQPAGTREFLWDGRSSDGAPIHGGVYFLRASIGNQAVVKKLILLTRGSSAAPLSPLTPPP